MLINVIKRNAIISGVPGETEIFSVFAVIDKPLIVLTESWTCFYQNKSPVQDDECNHPANVTHTANRPLSFGGNPSLFLELLDHYLRFTSGKKECHLVHFGDHLRSRESDRVRVEGSFSHLYTEFNLP